MSNPYAALDLSDDEDAKPTVVAPTEKKHVHVHPNRDSKPHLPRKEMKKEEQDLQQKKKGAPGHRGGNPPTSDVPHPGERSKIGFKKPEHVDSRRPAEGGERRGRQLDRHSGTGRGREMKKGGGGGHNWGKAGDENAPLPPKTPEPVEGETENKEAAVAAPPVVEEDPTLTLEEFSKQKALKRSGAAFEMKEVRKVVNEPTGTAYKKDEEVGEGVYIKLSEDHGIKKKPKDFKHKDKKVIELDLKYTREIPQEPPRFSGAGRGRGRPEGGRGGGQSRGGPSRGRGGPRGGSNAGNAVDTADQSAFPKLGGA